MFTEKLQAVEVGRLIPYINNARTHSADQINKLRASLREFGFVNPVLVDADLNILAGHGRVEAAKAEGYEKVPCVFIEHLTPAQKRAYILADNRLAEMSGWDEELLKIELDALKELDFDISLTGFDDFEFTADDVADDNFDVAAELEFTGLTREAAAKIIANYFGHDFIWGGCTGWEIEDNQRRTWKVVNDSSIRIDGGNACELVTPILTWADIETLQEIVRELRKAGAKVNETCGLHVHIGAQGLTAQAIRNLVNNVASHEDLLYKALAVHENRKRYCKPTDKNFLNRLNAKKPATLDELGAIWYGTENFPTYHYHESRYTILNLHAVFTKGTVEFRIFNGTLHAGEVKTAIQLCCALVAQAKAAKRTIYRPIQAENEKFAMRTWLTRNQGLNLNGTEFETLRFHLTKNLSGNAAWRYAV